MQTENSELRGELRQCWEDEKFGAPIWVEAARGGTVGAPDVMLPLGKKRGYCPVELKWWNVDEGRIKFNARPSQIRFHRLAGMAGQRTAFLAKLSTGDCVLLPGTRIVECNAMTYVRFIQLNRVRDTLLDENFWKGNN